MYGCVYSALHKSTWLGDKRRLTSNPGSAHQTPRSASGLHLPDSLLLILNKVQYGLAVALVLSIASGPEVSPHFICSSEEESSCLRTCLNPKSQFLCL